jgi:hypothetical protein
MWITFVCLLNLWALSNVGADILVPLFQLMIRFDLQNSFSFTRVVGFFWKFTILLSAIRALAMILELNNK